MGPSVLESKRFVRCVRRASFPCYFPGRYGAEKGVRSLKRLLQVTILFAVLACFAAGSASALTFQDRTCDNDKPTCPLPAGNAEVPYQFDMYARSGCPPYHYDIDGGTPPPGLTLSTVNDGASGGIGRLKGTPTTPGSYAFWVKLHTPESPTCLGDRADRLFTITIGAAPLGINTSSLRLGVVGATYTETLSASGGGSQTWSATGLPAGLAVSGSTITGTPTTAGNYPVTVSVNNGTSTKSAQFTLQIIDPLKVTGPTSRPAEVGKLFTATFQVSGGLGNYSWAATEVPAGLTFDAATHVLSGTPSVRRPLHRQGHRDRRCSRPDTGSAGQGQRRRRISPSRRGSSRRRPSARSTCSS